MPLTTLRIGTDAVVGTPPGDLGRGTGESSPSGSADWGACVRVFADTPTGLIVATNATAMTQRVRFLLDPADVNALEVAMGTGSIIFVQPFIRGVTFQSFDSPVNVLLTMEYPPSTNLTNIISLPAFRNWTNLSPNVYVAAGGATLNTGVPQVLAPGGVPWTIAILRQMELGLLVQAPNARYGCDIIGLTVEYVTAQNRWPMPLVGGAAGCQR